MEQAEGGWLSTGHSCYYKKLQPAFTRFLSFSKHQLVLTNNRSVALRVRLSTIMHSFIIFRAAVFALLAGSAFGESGFWSMLRLFKRQSQAFQPSTDLTPTCDANQLQCGPEPTPTCYTPSLGDVCCSGGCKHSTYRW